MNGKKLRNLLFVLMLLAAPGLLCVFAFFLPPQYEETYLGELKYKFDLLKSTKGQRIIVIGGSGVAFGQDSAMIEEAIPDYYVINFGMYAALGSVVMLELASPYIKEGDIVLFSPEQNEQTLSMYFDSEAMWQAADGEFSMLKALSKEQLGQMAASLGYFAADKFNFYREKSAPIPEGIYKRASFNEYGDVTKSGRECNIMNEGVDRNMLVTYDFTQLSPEFIEYLNNFAEGCRAKGADFYYRFCPVNEAAVKEEESIKEYAKKFQESVTFQVLGDPTNALLEAGWFYDTNFHLNSSGVIVNTQAMIADLKTVLGDTSVYETILPTIPKISETQAVTGNNTDADCFLYEYKEESNTYAIMGLSDKGRLQEALVLPVSYNDIPVTEFRAETFAGDEILLEVTIQENIRQIYDGSFAGCSSLQRIHLQQTDPEKCSVSEGLLAGTSGILYVPAEQVSNYMTNYFWSRFSDVLLPEPISDEASSYTPAEQEVSDSEQAGELAAGDTDSGKEEAALMILYEGNGGTVKESGADSLLLPAGTAHLRTNTALGSKLFEREGYCAVGWNTKADGEGEEVGFGSRISTESGLVLYLQWEKETPAAEFTYVISENEVTITKYCGEEATCVIPERIEGAYVTRIGANAFAKAEVDTVVLPPSIFRIDKKAFSGSSLKELYLYDSLHYVYDESFEDCGLLTKLHINAVTAPVYSGSYFDAFTDKMDWLITIKDRKKMVLFSGSSGRYGYNSPELMEAFPEFQVVNMGVYAYTNALPQLMLIREFMQEGDLLLSAPEFDTIHNQFCESNKLDSKFFAMIESDYDLMTLLDLTMYEEVFDSLSAYLTSRSAMAQKGYEISASEYDDDGNHYTAATYNLYGDFTLERPNGQEDVLLKSYRAAYVCDSFPKKTIDSINAVYEMFLEKNITVYFSYAPRNRSSLTESSTLEERRKLQTYLEENLCVPVISDIEDYLYSGIYFYLIDNHLSTEGVELRTKQVICDLKASFRKKITPNGQ